MGIIGGLIGSGLSLINQQNQQDWNQSMYNQQKEFWYQQQEYNSPANQVKRLEEAGINPQLALGNITSGQMGSSPSVPTMSAAQIGNFAGATDSILQLVNNKNQQRKVTAEAQNLESDAVLKEIDGFTRFAKNLQDLDESFSRESKNRIESYITGIVGTAEERLKQAMASETENRVEMQWMDYAKGLIELNALPHLKRAEYLERMANIAKMNAETSTEKQRKQKLIQETNHEFFKAKGQKFVNSLNEKTEQFLIRQRRLQGAPDNPWHGILTGIQSGYDMLTGD